MCVICQQSHKPTQPALVTVENLRRLLGPDGPVYGSTLLRLLKELHTIWADLTPKGNMLDSVETGPLHTPLVVFAHRLPVPLTGVGKKPHWELQLPDLSETEILTIRDRPILFLF